MAKRSGKRKRSSKTAQTKIISLVCGLLVIAAIVIFFMEIVRETALPVIAMKGIATAEHAFGGDIKALIYERCGMVPEDTEIHDWFRLFKNLHRAELLEYRSRQFAAALAGDEE